MSEAVVTLKKGEGRSLKAGGLWVYDNEVGPILISNNFILTSNTLCIMIYWYYQLRRKFD